MVPKALIGMASSPTSASSVSDGDTSVSARFHAAVAPLRHEWGFVVVRTAYHADPDTDAAQWAAALERLRAAVRPCSDFHPDTVALPVVAHRAALDGKPYSDLRSMFNQWVVDHEARYDLTTPVRDDESEVNPWPSDVRTDCFLVVDQPALDSLLLVPPPPPPEEHRDDDDGQPNAKRRRLQRAAAAKQPQPWVVFVDAGNPYTVGYRGGAPYLGWMRVLTRDLGDLAEDVDIVDCLEHLCPIRDYLDQISIYHGSPIDPVDPPEDRYKCPQGTLRGIDSCRAVLQQMEDAVGGVKPWLDEIVKEIEARKMRRSL